MRICWSCGKHQPLAAAVDHSDVAPRDGDLSICIACGEWNVFEGDHLRSPTSAEYDDIGTDEECRRVRAGWAAMDQFHRSQAH